MDKGELRTGKSAKCYGLLEDDDSWDSTMEEAVLCGSPTNAWRDVPRMVLHLTLPHEELQNYNARVCVNRRFSQVGNPAARPSNFVLAPGGSEDAEDSWKDADDRGAHLLRVSADGRRVYFDPARGAGSLADVDALSTRAAACSSLGAEGEGREGAPPPSTEREKRDAFRGFLTTILSCVYAVFIMTLGIVIYVSDVILGNVPLAAGFNMYLVTFGFIYLVLLYTDIRRYHNRVNAQERFNEEIHDMEIQRSFEGNLHLSVPFPTKMSSPGDDLRPVHYAFHKGQHTGSFYLKMGAAVFCFGHLIHSGLLLSYQIVFLTSEQEEFLKCASIVSLFLDAVYPAYSFFLLFFVFKYSHVVINRCKELARFALMHCISCNLCFWVWTIIRETMDSINAHANHRDREEDHRAVARLQESLRVPAAMPLQSYQQRGAEELIHYINKSVVFNNFCLGPPQMAEIYDNFSPYLYPFTIEYNILVVGILYVIWQNIGGCEQSETLATNRRMKGRTKREEFASNLVIHADCHSSNKGLFAGMIVLVGSVVSIILFFLTMADKEVVGIGLRINAVTELFLLIAMTTAVVFAYNKVTQLDINHHPLSLLDDLLLFMCIPAFFLYAIFSIIPAIQFHNYVSITIIILQVVQVLLQTPFIMDGLRRCSNSRALRLMKPGRELVTFLIVCNIAMWITETFEIKSHDRRDHRYEIYGTIPWALLKHLTIPLTMFYRFHSSVCLVDIWKSAYERGGS